MKHCGVCCFCHSSSFSHVFLAVQPYCRTSSKLTGALRQALQLMARNRQQSNYPRDAVQVQALAGLFKEVLKEYGPHGFYLHDYNGLWSSCAARPSLADLENLLNCLVRVSPSLNVGQTDLKCALGDAFYSLPDASHDLNREKIAAQLVVAQKHLRNLKAGKDSAKLVSVLKGKMTHTQAAKLDKLLAQVSFAPVGLSNPNKSPEKKRTLHSTPSVGSEASVDDNGFPRWSFLPEGKKPAGETEYDDGDELLQGEHALGLYTKPPIFKKPSGASAKCVAQPKKVVKKPGCASAKGVAKPTMKGGHAKAPSASFKGVYDVEKIEKGPFKVHGPFEKTGKSYITSDKSHLVTCTRGQSAKFHDVILKIYTWIQKTKSSGVTRSQANKKRIQLIAG